MHPIARILLGATIGWILAKIVTIVFGIDFPESLILFFIGGFVGGWIVDMVVDRY